MHTGTTQWTEVQQRHGDLSVRRSGDVGVVVVVVGVDGADDVDGVEDAAEVAEDGEQHADPELRLPGNANGT